MDNFDYGYTVSGGLGRRVIAWFVDSIIWVVCISALSWLVSPTYVLRLLGLGDGITGIIAFMIFFILFSLGFLFLYNFAFEAWRGQTPGKMFVGIVTIGHGGRRVTPDRAAFKAAWKILYAFFGILALVDGIIIYDEDRSFGDTIVGTAVVTVSSLRAVEYSQSAGAASQKNPYAGSATCKKCGGNVNLYKDGSGLCESCGASHLGP